ncbi:glycosyltransferase [Mucilaginibacter jinjuensis]|uniref:Glycosyltransferase n=1 Tax=Mucilaginibacter jinjuensis TaxID=1176721 RepID=A0ABY7TFE7_9SPHI|nr:glycosyltransferase [Mucilaginibacter jinjuensis]WCT14923.1 glycosyltransferase [Mucilaginibacter jinjuensis]
MAKSMNIFYLEEPVTAAIEFPHYAYSSRGHQITIVTPQLPEGLNEADSLKVQKQLFTEFMANRVIADYGFWYYTPMALEFSRGYQPEITVFDCMDELSAFRFAPESLKALEKELMLKADIVFTGGHSLYEAKKKQHHNIHAFPSSIDKLHFAKARDLKHNKRKTTIKLGFYGVIDERFDIELIRGIVKLRPEWEIFLIGPVVKIDPVTLPISNNIHYQGAKTYAELPELIADWDLALIPFLLNESTRFISPTKTPEYLAAGLPVISTPIRDVINPYGKFGLVSIGHDAEDFVACAENELNRADNKEWLQKVDFFLAHNSWDETCDAMTTLMNNTIKSTEVVYNTIAKSNV